MWGHIMNTEHKHEEVPESQNMSGLAEPDPAWTAIYDRERKSLNRAIGKQLRQIDHIGSTSVPNLRARPEVDILLGVYRLKSPAYYETLLKTQGYEHVVLTSNLDCHYFRHATHPVQLIVTQFRSPCWETHLVFRDILKGDPHVRAEYEAMKGYLIKEHGKESDGYRSGKSEFIEKILARAKKSE